VYLLIRAGFLEIVLAFSPEGTALSSLLPTFRYHAFGVQKSAQTVNL
jgi:hypothetical protein